MKRALSVVFALVLPLVLGACPRGPQVIVHAQAEALGAEQPVNLADLPVRLLPYDRDAIFDSLEAAHPDPEPAIPPEIVQQQQEVQRAQAEWSAASERWGEVRDSLRTLADEMQRMTQQGLRGTPQYQQAFRNFERLDAEERQQQQRRDAAFQRFTSMQEAVIARADSIRVLREGWADRAYADFDQAVDERLQALRREEYADTTDASGTVRFRAPRGRWWVYARYTLPYEELYWNVPIEVANDSVRVELRRENAQVRPVL